MIKAPPARPPADLNSNDTQSFVLRLRADRTALSENAPLRYRIGIRAEHVNAEEVAFHASVEAALSWLEARMRAVIPAPSPGEGR